MFEIKIINSGYIMADGGAMFGAIPKRAWKRKYAHTEDNLCPLVMRCVLAISEDKKILIDTGMGDKHLNKASYYQPHNLININQAIKSFGYSPKDITDVILTHLHFDHCGYATMTDEDGKIVPSFPKAKYWLSKKQWETYLNPNLLEVDSIFKDNIQPVHDAGILNLIEGNTQLYDGFELRLFDGHSTGQIVVYMDTENGKYTFPGDLIPTSAHIPIEWISGYDICALTSVNEKQRFLEEAVHGNYTLIYCHDSETESGRVKKLNDNFKAYK